MRYITYCVDKRTSDELYQIYHGNHVSVPEHMKIWQIPLIDFQVKEPIVLTLPMAIDFGSVNTTAGVYLDTAYMERIGRNANILGLKENAVNYTLFDEEGAESMLLPSVLAVKAVEAEQRIYAPMAFVSATTEHPIGLKCRPCMKTEIRILAAII